MNIIGDIAGRFDELMLLLVQMPKDEKIILVGDLVDRGPKSKEVIEWAMSTPNVITLMGNHEHMMIDYLLNTGLYGPRIWEMNGGDKTLDSYYDSETGDVVIPKEHLEWLKNLPKFYKEEGLYISHAPLRSTELGYKEEIQDFLWNRNPPPKVPGVFQIFGHNSSMKKYGDYSICIDDCSKRKLTGIHWPSKKIYQQDYLPILRSVEINPED